MSIIQWVLDNYQSVLSAGSLILSGVIGVSLLIPGDQPEKFLQSILDFLKKFSKK